MTDVSATAGPVKRPGAITGICVLGLVGVAALLFLALSGGLSNLPDWYVIFLGVTVIANIIAMAGMFMMRKWGAYLYAIMFAVAQVVLLMTGLWAVQTAIVPAIVTFVALSHVGRMR